MLKKIDCLGDICPVPLMKVQRVLAKIQAGEDYLVVTDHSCALNNIKDYCKKQTLYQSNIEIINGVWEITLSNKPFD